jgi:hypothetical protein
MKLATAAEKQNHAFMVTGKVRTSFSQQRDRREHVLHFSRDVSQLKGL